MRFQIQLSQFTSLEIAMELFLTHYQYAEDGESSTCLVSSSGNVIAFFDRKSDKKVQYISVNVDYNGEAIKCYSDDKRRVKVELLSEKLKWYDEFLS